jgi:hypothetical protein
MKVDFPAILLHLGCRFAAAGISPAETSSSTAILTSHERRND